MQNNLLNCIRTSIYGISATICFFNSHILSICSKEERGLPSLKCTVWAMISPQEWHVASNISHTPSPPQLTHCCRNPIPRRKDLGDGVLCQVLHHL